MNAIRSKTVLLLAGLSILSSVAVSVIAFDAVGQATASQSRAVVAQAFGSLFKPCDPSVRDRVIVPTLDKNGHVLPDVEKAVEIDCSLTLQPEDVVTKRLVLTGDKASGVTINCNGATINGRHLLPDYTIVVFGAKNIVVRKCNVHGSIRIFGVDVAGDALREASYRPDHTRLWQAVASRNITFDNMHITAYGPNPFYVTHGATRVTLKNSTMRGNSGAVAIYLDAETAENVIKDNDIAIDTRKDEQIAIDGSARNLIVGNRFSGLDRGGVFLFRNCGEGGVIRQQGPEDNVIIDNVFHYRKNSGIAGDLANLLSHTPAVWIAERQNDLPGYCDQDGKPDHPEAPNIGSNLDHLDHAYRTVVAYNRFVDRDPNELIRVHEDPSYVFENVRVGSAGDRNSPCYAANGYPSPIFRHGESVAMFDDGAGPRCTGRRLTCNDGIAIESTTRCFNLVPRVEEFQCHADRSNKGCSDRASCPRGTSLVAAKAACNLEFGQVSSDEFNKTPWSFAGVVRRSDNPADGDCRLGPVGTNLNGVQLGALPSRMEFSCKEKDDNGGDCHIRVALACQGDLPELSRPKPPKQVPLVKRPD